MAQDRKLDESVQESKSQVTTVTTVKLQMTPGESEVTLPSNLQAINTTTINARTSGYVRKRYVDIGSKVKAGDVLAEIESPEVDQQVMQSQAQVANAQAAVGQAQANYSRSLASTSGARSDYVRYQANLEGAKADLSHLHARYSQAQSAVDVAQARLIQAQKKLDGMRAELERAKVERHLAEVTLKRWKELEKSDAVSGQDVDEKQSIYDASMTRVTAAQADVNSSEADVQAAQQTVRGARADVLAASADITSGEQRIQAAKAAIGTSQANIDAALAASRASQSEIVAAQATVASNESAVRRYAAVQSFEKVVAPFAGVITARNVDEGDLVGATSGGSGASDQLSTVTKTGLFGLARTDTIRAQANVPEDAVGLIRNGQRAEITTREYQGKVFVGQVFNVSGALDATSRTLLVEASIPNPLGLLKPGMYGQIRFVGAKTASIVRIPANTLIFDAKGTRVAVVGQDNTVHFVTVKVGRDYGKELEILNGLHGDEILITNPDETLEEGQKVKPVAKPL
ncbi:MAG: efflux RND transporter periplasmic adaptor subunit [Fimbriimonas sp.]|nr:efflux RND transporter periplasmic adaptor subunit [Fimbriimonas sp.]